jgi:hypothetical protein
MLQHALPNGCLSSRSGGELREACRALSGAERPAGLDGVVHPAGFIGERPVNASLNPRLIAGIGSKSCRWR